MLLKIMFFLFSKLKACNSVKDISRLVCAFSCVLFIREKKSKTDKRSDFDVVLLSAMFV